MTLDIKQLEALLADKKYDEARKVIGSTVSAKMTDSDKGAALVGLASTYLDATNSVNARYRDALKEAVAGLEAVNAAESKVNDKIKLAEVRAKLKK